MGRSCAPCVGILMTILLSVIGTRKELVGELYKTAYRYYNRKVISGNYVCKAELNTLRNIPSTSSHSPPRGIESDVTTDYGHKKFQKWRQTETDLIESRVQELDRRERELAEQESQLAKEFDAQLRIRQTQSFMSERIRQLERSLVQQTRDRDSEASEAQERVTALEQEILELEQRELQVETKEKGQYTPEVRWFTARLQRYNVAPGNVAPLMRDMSEAFDIRFHGGLPSRMSAATFQDEQASLADLEFGLSTENLALTTDNGSRDYKTANVIVGTTSTTPCYPLGVNYIPNHSGKTSGAAASITFDEIDDLRRLHAHGPVQSNSIVERTTQLVTDHAGDNDDWYEIAFKDQTEEKKEKMAHLGCGMHLLHLFARHSSAALDETPISKKDGLENAYVDEASKLIHAVATELRKNHVWAQFLQDRSKPLVVFKKVTSVRYLTYGENCKLLLDNAGLVAAFLRDTEQSRRGAGGPSFQDLARKLEDPQIMAKIYMIYIKYVLLDAPLAAVIRSGINAVDLAKVLDSLKFTLQTFLMDPLEFFQRHAKPFEMPASLNLAADPPVDDELLAMSEDEDKENDTSIEVVPNAPELMLQPQFQEIMKRFLLAIIHVMDRHVDKHNPSLFLSISEEAKQLYPLTTSDTSEAVVGFFSRARKLQPGATVARIEAAAKVSWGKMSLERSKQLRSEIGDGGNAFMRERYRTKRKREKILEREDAEAKLNEYSIKRRKKQEKDDKVAAEDRRLRELHSVTTTERVLLLTVPELKDQLKKRAISYSSKAKKSELQDLLVQAVAAETTTLGERIQVSRKGPDWLSLESHCVFIIDCETTGLDRAARLVQIAILSATDDFNWMAFVHPGSVPVQKQASDKHGLTKRKLNDLKAREWNHVGVEFWAAVRKVAASKKLVFIGHNISFDYDAIIGNSKRFLSTASEIWEPPPIQLFDTIKLAKAIWGNLPEYNLEHLKVALALPAHEQNHRADADCRLLKHLLGAAAARLKISVLDVISQYFSRCVIKTSAQ